MNRRLPPEEMYPAGHSGVAVRMTELSSGLRIRVAESGPRSGPPVLLIHGWGACLYTYRFLLPVLAAAGWRAIAVDLRGHGLSDKPVGRGSYTSAALLDDLCRTLDALELERSVLVGHSLGGAAALQLVLERPERVSRLVLAAPVGLSNIHLRRFARTITPRFTNRFASHLVPRWLVAMLVRGAYGDPGRVTDRNVDEYWAPSRSPDYYRAMRALLEEFTWEPVPPERLATIRTPTLVILGTRDRLVRGTEEPAEYLAGSSVLAVQGAGHLGIEERHEEVNAAILRFLSSP